MATARHGPAHAAGGQRATLSLPPAGSIQLRRINDGKLPEPRLACCQSEAQQEQGAESPGAVPRGHDGENKHWLIGDNGREALAVLCFERAQALDCPKNCTKDLFSTCSYFALYLAALTSLPSAHNGRAAATRPRPHTAGVLWTMLKCASDKEGVRGQLAPAGSGELLGVGQWAAQLSKLAGRAGGCGVQGKAGGVGQQQPGLT